MTVKCVFTEGKTSIHDIIKDTFTLYIKNEFSEKQLKTPQSYDIIKHDERALIGGVV